MSINTNNHVLLNYSKKQETVQLDPHCNVLRVSNTGKIVSCATVMVEPMTVISRLEAAKKELKASLNVSFIILDFNTIVLSVQDHSRNIANQNVQTLFGDDTDSSIENVETSCQFPEFAVC